MLLREWFEQIPEAERVDAIARIAKLCDVTPAAVRHWRSGIRNVPAPKCGVVSDATGGNVSRAELRPDIWAVVAEKKKPVAPAGLGAKKAA